MPMFTLYQQGGDHYRLVDVMKTRGYNIDYCPAKGFRITNRRTMVSEWMSADEASRLCAWLRGQLDRDDLRNNYSDDEMPLFVPPYARRVA
jgi:hypothetical protein